MLKSNVGLKLVHMICSGATQYGRGKRGIAIEIGVEFECADKNVGRDGNWNELPRVLQITCAIGKKWVECMQCKTENH